MTVIKHKNQRVGIFIDAQNLYHSAKNLHHGRVNFGEVLNIALAGRQLVRALAYVITTDSGEEKNFFEALTKMGIETKTKDLQIFSGGSKKADWDVGLAVDAIKLSDKLDVVILASGDGDFVPLVEYIKMKGCQVEVVTFGKSASSKLKEVADDFIDLDNNTNLYVLGQKHDHFERQEYIEKRELFEKFNKNGQKTTDRITDRKNPVKTNSQPTQNKQNKITKVVRKLR